MPRKAVTPTPADSIAPDVRLVRLDTLSPDPDNVRVHPETNLKAIRESLTAFGQQRPLVVMEDGLVLAGNGTLEAARQLGWQHIAVQVCTLPLDQARAYAVADNRTGELSSWNETGLATLLRSLHEQALPLPGWDEAELKKLCATPLPVIQEADIPPDRGTELREQYGVEPGQLWACGEHRVICGDCTEKAVLKRVLGDGTIEAVITDPPYGVEWNTDYTRFTNDFATQQQRYAPLVGDERPFDPRPWLDYPKVLLWGANWYCQHIPLGSWLVWDKRHSSGAAILSDAELAWMKGKRGISLYAETLQGAIRTERSMHPTQKPVGLMAWCLEKAEVQEMVFDPFLGSGSMLLAAHQLNRRCYGIEIDPGYVAVALERFYRLTGASPTLVEP